MKPGLRRTKGVTRHAPVKFIFDQMELEAPAGESVAAALLANGIRAIRHGPEDGQPRGAFCFIGLCQECLVEIDGNQIESCRVSVRDGLEIGRVRYQKKPSP